MALSSTRTAVK